MLHRGERLERLDVLRCGLAECLEQWVRFDGLERGQRQRATWRVVGNIEERESEQILTVALCGHTMRYV